MITFTLLAEGKRVKYKVTLSIEETARLFFAMARAFLALQLSLAQPRSQELPPAQPPKPIEQQDHR